MPLAHYSSASGIAGILSSKSLWATHIQFLNDSREFLHAIGLAREHLETVRRSGIDASASPLTDALFQRLDAMPGNTWIVSFSEEGNLLSQWRGYCPAGGYVVSFRPQALKTLANRQNFILARCTYSRDEQVELVTALINATYENFNNEGGPPSNGTTVDDESRAASFCARWFFPRMLRLGSLMKDPAFFEEKEWRLIGGLYKPHITPNYRCNGPLIIPHRVFDLSLQSTLEDVVDSITIGPAFDQGLADIGLFFFMQHAQVGHIQIKRSTIPFRITR